MYSNVQNEKRRAGTIFNRNNIEIFIKSKVADFHLTENTMPSILLLLFVESPLFMLSKLSALFFSWRFALNSLAFVSRRDGLNRTSHLLMLLLFPARLFIGLVLCYQTHFHLISSTFRVMNKLNLRFFILWLFLFFDLADAVVVEPKLDVWHTSHSAISYA